MDFDPISNYYILYFILFDIQNTLTYKFLNKVKLNERKVKYDGFVKDFL